VSRTGNGENAEIDQFLSIKLLGWCCRSRGSYRFQWVFGLGCNGRDEF